MKVDDLALVGGWPHTRATLRRWNASPWRRARRLGARLARRDAAAARRDVARGDGAHPGSVDAARLPRPEPPGHLPRLRLRPGPQRHRARAARAGLRGRLHRRLVAAGQALRACRRSPGPRRSCSCIAATIFSLITQADALGTMLADLAFRLDVTPLQLLTALTPARAARAVRGLPAARGVVDREPPRRLGRAAGRHDRHDGDRRAAAPAGRRGRDLGHAAPADLASPG